MSIIIPTLQISQHIRCGPLRNIIIIGESIPFHPIDHFFDGLNFITTAIGLLIDGVLPYRGGKFVKKGTKDVLFLVLVVLENHAVVLSPDFGSTWEDVVLDKFSITIGVLTFYLY
jgi:hypothetical protein